MYECLERLAQLVSASNTRPQEGDAAAHFLQVGSTIISDAADALALSTEDEMAEVKQPVMKLLVDSEYMKELAIQVDKSV